MVWLPYPGTGPFAAPQKTFLPFCFRAGTRTARRLAASAGKAGISGMFSAEKALIVLCHRYSERLIRHAELTRLILHLLRDGRVPRIGGRGIKRLSSILHSRQSQEEIAPSCAEVRRSPHAIRAAVNIVDYFTASGYTAL